jgi:predicted NAD/FAD-binding protein
VGQKIAVVGTGVAGLSAAWLLSKRHEVTVYERGARVGGHANTVLADLGDDRVTAVDTGFIVYNEANYPNLTALFAHLGVATKKAEMDFAVSLDDGALEYGSASPGAIFAQKRNLVRPRFWAMLRDLLRFYREAPMDAALRSEAVVSIGEYLTTGGYCSAFLDDHLFPQAAAIWSASVGSIRDYPAAALVRFFENHGLLKIAGRPQWRTVDGGSTRYIETLSAGLDLRVNCGVRSVRRHAGGVWIEDDQGVVTRYDQALIATHADQALRLLHEPTDEERRLLGAFRYSPNTAVLHTDASLMPRRRAAWSSWNYLGGRDHPDGRCVTYWMNRLQALKTPEPLFVTLNPHRAPDPERVITVEQYDHPLFDAPALAAQRELWRIQGDRGVWYAGAHFGSGFHEDGLQAGLAAAEAMGGVRRPWTVAEESGRIVLAPEAGRTLAA